MTNTMTPSERADWLEGLARILRAEAQHSAAVNARWREHRWEPSEGLAKGCEQAAATIRAQAEQLKIATEALEAFKDEADAWELMGCSDREPIVEAFKGYEGRLTVGDLRRASAALTRMKEVG